MPKTPAAGDDDDDDNNEHDARPQQQGLGRLPKNGSWATPPTDPRAGKTVQVRTHRGRPGPLALPMPPLGRTPMTPLLFALGLASTAPVGLQDIGGSDKLLHAGATATITAAAWGAAAAVDAPLGTRVVAGVAAGLAAGVAKEAVDLAGFGTPSAGDLVYDGFGVALGVAFALIVEVLVEPAPAAAPSPMSPSHAP
jgi:hypothetical protein